MPLFQSASSAERTSSTLSGSGQQPASRRVSTLPPRKRGLGVDADITSERDVYFDNEVVRGEVTLIAEKEVRWGARMVEINVGSCRRENVLEYEGQVAKCIQTAYSPKEGA